MGMNCLFSISILAITSVACLSSDQLRRREYDAQYQQALQLCGHPDGAFQAGYNVGYGGDRMHGEWTAMCGPGARGQTFGAYPNGFLPGANNAPLRGVPP